MTVVLDPPEIASQLWDGFTGDVGWDIGAHNGQCADEMVSRFGIVYAFEPAGECFNDLRLLSNRYGDEFFRWFPIAVADTDDAVDLVELPGTTERLVSDQYPGTADGIVRRVSSRSVDTLVSDWSVRPPTFMKIDVEGHENRVLFGARKTLSLYRPDILLEFHTAELRRSCKDLLDGFGYSVTTIRHPGYEPGSGPWHSRGWLRAPQ